MWNRADMAPGAVLQRFSFLPRGGVQVVRYLTAALLQSGWSPRIASGSLGGPGELSHTATFFAGLPVSAADFTAALDAWRRGEDPLSAAGASWPFPPIMLTARCAPLGVPEDRVIVIPNGVDTEHFRRLDFPTHERLALLRHWLVDDPHGWDESGREGSIRYSSADLSAFTDSSGARPVLLYVGRFTAVKRLPLLLRAYARVRSRHGPVAPLIIWGGHPGEWEGEHPYSVVTRERIDGVFLIGWRGHDDLRLGLSCADLLVVPSVGEAFGSVYLEAMSAGLPVVATRTGGPPTFLNLDARPPEGWLIPPDDEDALVEVLVAALRCSNERQARADAAHALVRRGYSWQAVADKVADVYEAVRKS